MTYKDYNISDAQSVLLLDILITQQEILAELQKQNRQPEPTEEPAKVEPLPFEEKSAAEVKRPVRKPATNKTVKKKTKSKSTKK